MVVRMVAPLWASVFRRRVVRRAVEESRLLVGSSRRMRGGEVINSYPIEVRFLSPPEIPLANHPPTLVS